MHAQLLLQIMNTTNFISTHMRLIVSSTRLHFLQVSIISSQENTWKCFPLTGKCFSLTESVFRWLKNIFCWPPFLMTNKHRKVWKLLSEKQTWPTTRVVFICLLSLKRFYVNWTSKSDRFIKLILHYRPAFFLYLLENRTLYSGAQFEMHTSKCLSSKFRTNYRLEFQNQGA
jgi:hypothetical protein